MTDIRSPHEKLASALIILVALPVALFTHAWTIQCWWSWFMVPYGAASITLGQAILLRMAAHLLTAKLKYPETPRYSVGSAIGHALAFTFLAPAMFYAVGWAFHAWVV